MQMMIDPRYGPDDFVRPGHINPLRSRDGGVLVRTGQTEGSIDLCRLAGLHPSAIIIEIMRDDGEMARVPDLARIATEHDLKMCSVAQIIEHRLARQSLVHRAEPAIGTPVRTPEGTFNLIAFHSVVDPLPHLALTVGGVGDLDTDGAPVESTEPTLVRMHRRDLLGDIFADLDSAPGESTSTAHLLRASMQAIQREGRGAIVYLRPEGSLGSDALSQRLSSIRRPDLPAGADTPDLTRTEGMPPALRRYGIGGQILRQLGLHKLRLLTNQPKSLPALDAFGLEIVETVGIEHA
jgi:3,4-dihydroxy 2-butanone 4-phosphate synthase/GTP cyclohydrolase II